MRDATLKSCKKFDNDQNKINFLAFTESLNDGLYITNEYGIIVYSNSGLAKILGCETPDQVIGRSFLDFLREPIKDELQQKYQNYLETNIESSLITAPIIRKDGLNGIIEIKPGKSTNPKFSQGVVRDITDIRRIEQRLHEIEVRYQTIVELSPDAIILSTVEGSVIDFNDKALKLFNYKEKKEVIGLWIGSFVDPGKQKDLEKLLIDSIQKGEQLYTEVSLIRSNKSNFIGEVSIRLIGAFSDKSPLLMILARDITEKKVADEQLKTLAVTDPLTKLFNRRGFILAAEQGLRYAKRQKLCATIIYMDLNDMKYINDHFGHSIGDSTLVFLAQALKDTFRESDVLGRIGGDEFVILALDAPLSCFQHIKKRLNENLKKCDFGFIPSLACGAVTCDHESDLSLNQMLELADKEMYREKKNKAVMQN